MIRPDLDAAYGACQSITRHRAANFYYGIRLLPPQKRRALCAIYAFARRADDVADGAGRTGGGVGTGGFGGTWEPSGAGANGPQPVTRVRDVERLRAAAASLSDPAASGASSDPVVAALADAVRRFPLPLEAFDDLIDGIEMDVRGATFDTFDDLTVYCRRVAGSIGRLCVSVFGSADQAMASSRADDLGVAMQVTNILRDVREDARMGRRYLPAADLDRFRCSERDLNGGAPAAVALVLWEAARARAWFGRGLRLLPLLDRRSAACVAAMTGIYRHLLERIERRPEAVFAQRVRLSPLEKAWIAGASIAHPRPPASESVWVSA